MIYWDIFQVESKTENLIGVRFRGSLRKFSLEKEITLLAENAQDEENVVRFALLSDKKEDSILQTITEFVQQLVPTATIREVLANVPNPILSKLKNNDVSRY